MASSPLVDNMDFVSVEILINGKALNDTFQVTTVEVQNTIGSVPNASFTLLLPQENTGNVFESSGAKELFPGNEVEIKAGYSSITATIFKGTITHQSIKAGGDGPPQITIHCQDEAVKMKAGKKVRAFEKQTDSSILQTIIAEYGLSTNLADTEYEHPQLIQVNTTDWNFALRRATANGLLLYAHDGEIFAQKPLTNGEADLVLTYGLDVLEFEAKSDAGYLPSAGASPGSVDGTHGLDAATPGEPVVEQMITTGGNSLVDVNNPSPPPSLEGGVVEPPKEVPGSSRQGRVAFPGNATPRLNTPIDLAGFGSFSGSVLISSISHTISAGEWRTETGFGLSPDLQQEDHTLVSEGNDLLPDVSGLQIGVVKQIEDAPDGEHLLLVTLPALSADVWARHSTLYATQGKGSFFLPEVGDEVIVGFLYDDPRRPVILGSVFSAKNAPPYTADKYNSIKAFVTQSDLKIEMNDADQVLTIATPGGNSFVLSDKDRSIALEDQHGNQLTMDRTGIALKSTGNITLDADGGIDLKAKQKIAADASGGDVSLKGLNVKGNGQVGIELKGGATAELSAGGQTIVKGAMVMIN